MSKKTFNIIFIIFAALAFFSLLNHTKEIIYPDKSPHAIITLVGSAWHAFFILINAICIYGILKRPEWFIWFLGLLILHQWYIHGSYLAEFWKLKHQVRWISIVVIVLLPLLFYFLMLEQKFKQKD